jgi:hypothetical protein
MTRTIYIVASNDPALPADRIRFNGLRKDASTVLLEWENKQESNNGTYEVQRSLSPEGPFTTVATIKAQLKKGNNVSTSSYETHDFNNYKRTSYYRLLQKGANGTSNMSEIRKVNGSEVFPHVTIWPIPAKGKFNVLLTDMSKTVTVRVYRIDGAMVGKEELVFPGIPRSFNISSPGTYIVKGINKENGELVFAKKLVIE